MKALLGRRALVTGATSGIGKATVAELSDRGAEVVATGRDAEALQPVVTWPGVTGEPADLTSGEQQRRLLSRAGSLDVVVAAAGVGWVGLVEDMPEDEVDRIVTVNTTATILLVRRALGQLRPGGHLVLISSLLGWAASPPLTVYSASKFAIHGFACGLRREVAHRGLYVTEVAPGPVATAFFPRATHRPAAGSAPDMPMIAADRVARAIRQALEHPGGPFSRTVSVPRAAGVIRLAELPGLDALSDLVGRVARSPAVLRPPSGDGVVEAS